MGLPAVPSPVIGAVVTTSDAFGTHDVPFHVKTCPFVAPFWARSNGFAVVPSPVNLAVTLTSDSSGTHALPSQVNTCPIAAPFCAIVGFGYVPVKSPPAAPPGVVPVIVTLPAFVSLPCASTVNVPTCVALS